MGVGVPSGVRFRFWVEVPWVEWRVGVGVLVEGRGRTSGSPVRPVSAPTEVTCRAEEKPVLKSVVHIHGSFVPVQPALCLDSPLAPCH